MYYAKQHGKAHEWQAVGDASHATAISHGPALPAGGPPQSLLKTLPENDSRVHNPHHQKIKIQPG